MKGLKRTLAAASIAALALLTVACGGAKKQTVYGMTVRDASAPYMAAMIHGAEAAAAKLGAKLVVLDSKNDVLQQLNQMDSLLAQGVSGLLFGGTIDTAAVIPGIKKFNDRKIPIMALDNSPEGGKVDLWLSFDITESSKKAAELFVAKLKEKHGADPKGVVIEITGALGDAFTNECTAGFHSVIDAYKGIQVAQGEGKWDNDASFQRTTELLTKYGKKVIGIYVHTPDIMGTGTVKAVEQAKLKPADYFITGICMGPEGRDLIKEGKIYAIVNQPALDAATLAVQYLWDLNHGKAIPKVGDTVKVDNALWSPAEVVKNPLCEGAFMKLQGPVVPLQVSPDDARLWENQIAKQ
jgi:ribose transport system substrate-binding protein